MFRPFSLIMTALLAITPAASALASLPAPPDGSEQRVVSITTASERLEDQRARFLKAEAALEQRDMDRYKELLPSLEGYPLYPYLELLRMQKRLFVATPGEVHEMMATHGHIPKAHRLRWAWLLHLGRSGEWETLAREHDGSTGSDRLRCLSLQAQLKTGNHSRVMNQVPELWRSGYSLPDACNPLLDYWRDNGGLTADLAWTRFQMALEAGNYNLASYLRRYLDSDDRNYSSRLIELHHRPDRLRLSHNFDRHHPRAATVVAHAIQRLVQTNPEKAAKVWPFYRERFDFAESDIARIEKRLGLILATRFHEDAAKWLDSALQYNDDASLHEWRVRIALRKRDWPGTLDAIKVMPHSLSSKPDWQYWLARALDQTGHPQAAQAIFETIADNRSFYGFMAADQLGKPYELNHKGLVFEEDQVSKVSATPALKRARELYKLDRLDEARREWRQMRAGLDDRQILLASRLAQGWGWHEQGVQGAIATSAWDHLAMRFPLAYREQFHSAAREQGLDVNWIYALARQESAFRHDARSHRGAIGLLQLLPATARQTAREAGMPYNNLATLLDPKANIQLGTAHLSTLLKEFDDNRILATAAYNAGAHRVRQWLGKETADLDSDIWVETMPYHETRQYVRRVMAYTVIYGYRRGEPPGHLLTKRELACMCLDE
jgi:soluble lytic murein transglycosylase